MLDRNEQHLKHTDANLLVCGTGVYSTNDLT